MQSPPSVPPFAGGPALVFAVDAQRFGLPVDDIVRIVEMVAISPLPGGPEPVVGVVDFQGQVIPIVDLRRRLGWAVQPYTLRTPIVIARLNRCTVGLVVDGVSGVVEIGAGQVEPTSRIVPPPMGTVAHFVSAVARLDDGLVLFLDPATLLSRQEQEALLRAPAAPPAPEPVREKDEPAVKSEDAGAAASSPTPRRGSRARSANRTGITG